MFVIFSKLFIGMLNRDNGEVIFEVNNQETHGYILLFWKMTDYLSWKDHTWVFTWLKTVNWCHMISDLGFLFFIGREFDWFLKSGRNWFHEVGQFLRLEFAFSLNECGSLDHKVDNTFGLLFSLEIWIDLMSLLIISYCFIVSFKIFIDSSSIIEKIRIRFFL